MGITRMPLVRPLRGHGARGAAPAPAGGPPPDTLALRTSAPLDQPRRPASPFRLPAADE